MVGPSRRILKRFSLSREFCLFTKKGYLINRLDTEKISCKTNPMSLRNRIAIISGHWIDRLVVIATKRRRDPGTSQKKKKTMTIIIIIIINKKLIIINKIVPNVVEVTHSNERTTTSPYNSTIILLLCSNCTFMHATEKNVFKQSNWYSKNA